MRNVFTKIIGWVVALLGGFFTVAGAQLVWLGGSPYYVLAGLAMIVSGALTGRLDRRGPLLFLAVWIATLVWAVWEVGLDWLQLVPRVVAPTVLLGLVALPFPFAPRRRPVLARGAAIAAVALVAFAGGMATLRPAPSAAQDGTAAPTPVSAQTDAGDWQAYGGTLAGDRYSALDQITPANVGRLKLAWTQRTGDVVQHDEAVTHKREYHSEATPIHVGDSLYTCRTVTSRRSTRPPAGPGGRGTPAPMSGATAISSAAASAISQAPPRRRVRVASSRRPSMPRSMR